MTQNRKLYETNDGCDTLDVVVEGAVSVPVFVEDAEGVAVGKILKLYQAVHPVPAGAGGNGEISQTS